MPGILYRFRPIKRLIGLGSELQNQEIYFAKISQLNDPMEGSKFLFWDGDEVMWRNLFLHYVRCLINAMVALSRGRNDEALSIEEVSFKNPCLLDNDGRDCCGFGSAVEKMFFNGGSYKSIIEALSGRETPVGRDELYCYLLIFHRAHVADVYEALRQMGMIDYELDLKSFSIYDDDYVGKRIRDLIDIGEAVERDEFDHVDEKSPFALIRFDLEMVPVMFPLTHDEISISTWVKNVSFCAQEFPEKYVSSLDRLVHPDWRVACFMANCKNPTHWAHYADSNRGACLIFEHDADEVGDFINLGVAAESGVEFSPLRFQDVNYSNNPIRLEFFKSLGSLPHPVLRKQWLFGVGGPSDLVAHYHPDNAAWWDDFYSGLYLSSSTKLTAWESEGEKRLVIFGKSGELHDVPERLSYDFGSLVGIVFGVRTETHEKLEIMRVLIEKCRQRNRTDFKFYQAYYSTEGVVEKREIQVPGSLWGES